MPLGDGCSRNDDVLRKHSRPKARVPPHAKFDVSNMVSTARLRSRSQSPELAYDFPQLKHP